MYRSSEKEFDKFKKLYSLGEYKNSSHPIDEDFIETSTGQKLSLEDDSLFLN